MKGARRKTTKVQGGTRFDATPRPLERGRDGWVLFVRRRQPGGRLDCPNKEPKRNEEMERERLIDTLLGNMCRARNLSLSSSRRGIAAAAEKADRVIASLSGKHRPLSLSTSM